MKDQTSRGPIQKFTIRACFNRVVVVATTKGKLLGEPVISVSK